MNPTAGPTGPTLMQHKKPIGKKHEYSSNAVSSGIDYSSCHYTCGVCPVIHALLICIIGRNQVTEAKRHLKTKQRHLRMSDEDKRKPPLIELYSPPPVPVKQSNQLTVKAKRG